MSDSVQLDLGPADVHTPSAGGAGDKPGAAQGYHVDLISADKRNSLPERAFALPAQRKYPLDTAARVRNAAARLEQMRKRGKVSDADYKTARGNIATAAKKFGIESQYNEKDGAPAARDNRKRIPRTIHVRADLAPGGALHVRHMSARSFYDVEGVLLVDDHTDGDAPVWIQIAKSGQFAGHSAGPFELNTKVFEEIIANFKSTRNRHIPIDYEHASEQDATSGSIPINGAPAQGWIRDLKIDGTNLWGLVEWLPQARAQIRSKQYRYLSPAIRFGTKDRVTGKPAGARLSSAALTNEPFLDGMAPLAAKDQGAGGAAALETRENATALRTGPSALVHQTHEYMPKLKAALKLDDLASHEEMSDKLDRLRDMCMSAGPHGQHQGVDLSAYTCALRDLVGAAPGTSVEDLFDTVQDMIDAAIEEHEERYHEGPQASMSDKPGVPSPEPTTVQPAAATVATSTGETMEPNAELVTLKEVHAVTTAKVATLEGEKVTLTAKVTELEAKVAELSAKEPLLAAKDAEIKLLKDQVTAANEKVAAAEKVLADAKTAEEDKLVSERHLAYKDKKPMAKEAMLALFRSNKDLFEVEFPAVDPAHIHLQRDIVPPAPRPEPEKRVTLTSKALEIVKEKGISYAAALIEAEQILGS